MDRILGNIYLGSFNGLIMSGPNLKKLGITHILSIVNGEIPTNVTEGFITKQVEVNDEETEDIMKYFQECNEFIEQALYGSAEDAQDTNAGSKKQKQTGGIFIHCIAGVSRSVTITAAYLMWKFKLSAKDAVYAVKRKRSVASPNPGFLKQLSIYEQSGYDLIKNPKLYRSWVIENGLKLDPSGRSISRNEEIYASEVDVALGRFEVKLKVPKISSTENKTESPRSSDERVSTEDESQLRCRKCRQALALSTSLVTHSRPDSSSHQASFGHRSKPNTTKLNNSIQEPCSHYFLEPVGWMKPELQNKGEVEGKLNCPKCQSKVGGYSWKGDRCSCGRWMVPAIHLHRSKVDKVSLSKI